MTYDPNQDPVQIALLQMMADALVEEELGPDIKFILFVDWRDGRSPSYLSNIPRPKSVPILDEWLTKVRDVDWPVGLKPGGMSSSYSGLTRKCAQIGTEMVEEDIDVTLFLVAEGPHEVTWFSSMDVRGRRLVESWVKTEKSQTA